MGIFCKKESVSSEARMFFGDALVLSSSGGFIFHRIFRLFICTKGRHYFLCHSGNEFRRHIRWILKPIRDFCLHVLL